MYCIVHVPYIIGRGTADTDTNTKPTPFFFQYVCLLLLLLFGYAIPKDHISRGTYFFFFLFSFWKFFKSEIFEFGHAGPMGKEVNPSCELFSPFFFLFFSKLELSSSGLYF